VSRTGSFFNLKFKELDFLRLIEEKEPTFHSNLEATDRGDRS
jgi:hypothetical protein